MRPDKEIIEEVCNEYDGASKEIVRDAVTKAVQLKNDEFLKTHKSVYDIEKYDKYYRHLIQLRPDVAMLIHLFIRSSDDTWETIWLDDNEKFAEAEYECIRESAKQLMLQLEGHYCDAFVEALRDECNKILDASNKMKEKLTNK